MKYLLLTGSTGMVGRYLLRYLLEADVAVAAMVRPGKGPAQLERVMAFWEEELGRTLPRPVVIEGDLCHPQVVASPEQRDWLSRRCDRVLHCAASMTFREDRHGEPMRTNVEGTKSLLGLCREAGIRKFHHVSTAYICGLRTGRVYENEVDLQQQNGNIYEVSKLAGEKLLRAADHLDELTVYRPSSVVGDSTTGYTTSSHGFYLPLHMAYAMADKMPSQLMGDRFFHLLGLRGDEGKNLAPVDWLAKAICHLVTHSKHHCQTYHLANPSPVSVKLIQEVVQEAIEQFSTRRFIGEISEATIAEYEKLFLQYMDIYRSHWRDDPIFDVTNATNALPHLPCPVIDRAMLLRIAAYPIQKKFMLNPLTPEVAGFQPHDYLRQLKSRSLPVSNLSGDCDGLGLHVSGRRGGQWRLVIRDGRIAEIEPGLGPTDGARYYLNSHTFSSLVDGSVSAEQSVRSGGVLIEHDSDGDEQEFVRILQSIVACS